MENKINEFTAFLEEIVDKFKKTLLEHLNKDLHEIEGKNQNLTLDQMCYLTHKAGLSYNESKQVSERLEKLKKTKLSRIMMYFFKDNPKLTYAKAETMARASTEYEIYVNELFEAKKMTDDANVKHTAYQNLMDAKRSDQALEREKISKGIFHHS